MKNQIQKIKTAIFVCIAIVIAQGCQPNGGGVSPTQTTPNNMLVRKASNYIIQDNANGRIGNAAQAGDSIAFKYEYDASGRVINESWGDSSYLQFANQTIVPYKFFNYSAGLVKISENVFTFIGSEKYDYYITYDLTFRVNTISISRNNNPTTVINYTYEGNNQLSKIESRIVGSNQLAFQIDSIIYNTNNNIIAYKSTENLFGIQYTNSVQIEYSTSNCTQKEFEFDITNNLSSTILTTGSIFNSYNKINYLPMLNLNTGVHSTNSTFVSKISYNSIYGTRNDLYSFEQDNTNRVIQQTINTENYYYKY